MRAFKRRTSSSSFSFGNPDEIYQNPYAKWFLIPQRSVFSILGALVCTLSYALRSSISVTTIPENIKHNVTDACFVNQTVNAQNGSTYLFKHYWEPDDRRLVVSSFYWGYTLTQLPAGYLADRYGGKYVILCGLIGSSVSTMFYPLVLSHSKEDFRPILGIQFVNGFFQGTILPAITSMVAKWAPTSERTTIFCFVYGSIALGYFIVRIAGITLVNETQKWEPVFYLFASLGILLSPVWILLCFSSPQSNPFISGAEKAYLIEDLGQVDRTKIIVPWKKILKSARFWALTISAIGEYTSWHVIHQNLLFYLEVVLNFSLWYDPHWAPIPYLFSWIMAMCSACISDWLIYEKHVSTTLVRKSFTAISMVGTAVMLLFASFARCDALTVVTHFSAAMAFTGLYLAGASVSVIDLTSNFAGTFMGMLGISMSAMAAMASPLFVTRMARNDGLGEWQYIFWMLFFLLTGTSLLYVVLGSANEQRWNTPK